MARLSQDEIIETINDQEGNPKGYDPFNKWEWENYCGACDHFGIENECPRFGHVYQDTYWKGLCDEFWD